MLMKFIRKPIRVGAAAAAALFASAALVSAQQMPEKGREPSARDKGDGKEMREPPRARPDAGADQRKGGDRPDLGDPRGGSKGVEGPDKDRPKGAERPDRDRPKGAERPDKDAPKGAERPDKDAPKGAERPDKDAPKAAERPDKDRPKGAERPGFDQDKDRTKGAEGPERGQPKGARLSEQQRSEVGTKLRQTRVEKTQVRVNVNVGSPVPRTVRLYPLPAAILTVAPGYRGYSYFVREDDTIVIVDTRSYVVVEVIPAVTRAAGLSLSPEQMRFIHSMVPKERTVDMRLRLALGAEVPARVELLPFPSEVRAQIPELVGYRYIVAGDDVVIVDPRTRDIALVISE
jgi:hypothetical protein